MVGLPLPFQPALYQGKVPRGHTSNPPIAKNKSKLSKVGLCDFAPCCVGLYTKCQVQDTG